MKRKKIEPPKVEGKKIKRKGDRGFGFVNFETYQKPNYQLVLQRKDPKRVHNEQNQLNGFYLVRFYYRLGS